MAWIESHQSLLTHRKTVRASAILKVDRFKLIGHLHALWWWALDNAEDNGDLGETLPEEVAEAAGWPSRSAQTFVDALTSVGFLDQQGLRLSLHNWWTYAGKLNAKRATDRARKAERSAEVAGNSSGIPTEVAANSQAPTNTHTHQHTNQPVIGNSDSEKAAPTITPAWIKARDHPLNLSDDQWSVIYARFPDQNCLSFWREWVEWIEKSHGRRKPDDKLAALIGFIEKKRSA